MLGWLDIQNKSHLIPIPLRYINMHIHLSIYICKCIGRHMNQQSGKSQKALITPVTFRQEFRCLHLAEQTRKNPA